ncbi:MAG: hypothetical protein QXR87_03275 [Candidatus Hadarchaeales archaeon]
MEEAAALLEEARRRRRRATEHWRSYLETRYRLYLYFYYYQRIRSLELRLRAVHAELSPKWRAARREVTPELRKEIELELPRARLIESMVEEEHAVVRRAVYREEWPSLRDLLGIVRWWMTHVHRLKQELKVLITVLCRAKVRLYAVVEGPEEENYPRVFQAFFDVDAKMSEGLIDWNWWLTQKQLEVAKWDMIGEFSWSEWELAPRMIQTELYSFLPPRSLRWLPEPARRARAVFPKWRCKRCGFESEAEIETCPRCGGEVEEVPGEFYALYPKQERPRQPERLREIVRRVRKELGELTIEDIIVGLSHVAPREVPEPQGLFKERLLVVYRGRVQYEAEVNRWIRYYGWREDLEKAKKELAG